MMKRAGVLGAIAGAAVTGAAAPASAHGGKRFVLDVDTNGFADLDNAPSAGGATGAFYVSGVILAPDTAVMIGTFHCWGWIRPDGVGVVNQEFDIDGRGKILIAGVESGAPRGVTGGTDHFALARGQGVPDLGIFDFGNSGKFRIEFRLTGAKGRPIT